VSLRGLALAVLAAVLAGPLVAPATDGDACTIDARLDGRQTVESARYRVAFRTQPARIAVGEHFALELTVCPHGRTPQPDTVRVDAQMPEHRHGMNYNASVTSQGDGRYRAEGLLFHMPGKWQFVFDVERPGRTERLTADVVVE
jgi:hypothetical protein